MSTAETVKAQLQADIAAANEVTGKQDATMHDAVASLIEGFGGGEVLPEAAGLSEFPEEAYSVNGADLTAVGEAIAEKAGTEEPLAFPNGFVAALGTVNDGVHYTFLCTNAAKMFAMHSFERTPTDFPTKLVLKFPYFGHGGGMCDISQMFKYNSKIEDVEIHGNFGNYSQVANAFADLPNLRRVVLNGEGTPQFWRWNFQNNPKLEEARMPTLDLKKCALYENNFKDCPSLKIVELKANSIPRSENFGASSLLTDESLVVIANALIASTAETPPSLTLHADSQDRCTSINGTNSSGTFVLDDAGTMTLTEFITTVKGWTIA